MTIYDIKRLTAETAPHFFDRSTLKFFNQTLRDFRVYKCSPTLFRIVAPVRDRRNRKILFLTERLFDANTNQLLTISKS